MSRAHSESHEGVALTHAALVRAGPFEISDVLIEIVDGERSFLSEVHESASAHWAELVRLKPQCFDGIVWTIVEAEVDSMGEGTSSQLRMKLQRCRYSLAHFTHFSPKGLQLPARERSQVVGVGAATFTSEGSLISARRSQSVAMLPGHWSYIPVGVVDEPDILAVLRKELAEELAVTWDEVVDVWCLGLVDCGAEQGNLFNLAYVLQIGLTEAEVESRFKHAVDCSEHTELHFVNPADIDAFVRSQGGMVTSVAQEIFRQASRLSTVRARRACI